MKPVDAPASSVAHNGIGMDVPVTFRVMVASLAVVKVVSEGRIVTISHVAGLGGQLEMIPDRQRSPEFRLLPIWMVPLPAGGVAGLVNDRAGPKLAKAAVTVSIVEPGWLARRPLMAAGGGIVPPKSVGRI
ncbi:MAG: hypothetical protein L0Y67_00440 [Gammaproteobacteria bacterium]|nr:hypothetical protein [Gammaproteobacteria bacterium]